jgi:DNA repair photolyase
LIQERVLVFDIQTTTHNFYVRGILGDTAYHVHNCSVGCTSFCYVMSGQYGYRATGLTSVPLNYGQYVRKQLGLMQTGQAGYFSSFTDPFMKIEEYYHNTQKGATEFVRAGLPVFFLSRLRYPGWAFDLLEKNKYSYMQKSINTPNEEDWKMLSPGAASLAEHFEQIREAHRRGIYVSIQCNPIIPGVVDHSDIENLIELLAEAGADHVIFKFVESNHAWKNSMVERLTEKFGTNRMAIFAELMSEAQAGNQTTIQEEYRREGHERYRAKCQSLGLTSALCYEFTKASGMWRSMGPEFLTADQCHGHRVPFHVKQADGKFHPLGVCPPSGCLSCADDNGGAACGSGLLGAAKALTLTDFKKDPGVTVASPERYRPLR